MSRSPTRPAKLRGERINDDGKPMIALPKNTKCRSPAISNADLADRLDVQADRIAERDDNPYHVTAYRRAAETLRSLERPAAEILDEQGRAGLEQLPGIGKSLARRIERMVLGHDEGKGTDAVQLFATIGDIGPELGRRIHDFLGVDTLAELYAAAYDGRLAQVPGIGPKRLRAVREALTARAGRPLNRPMDRRGSPAPNRSSLEEIPPVEVLLDIDREYRKLASQDRLPKIAPRQFNPTGEAWLPILHTEHEGEHFTAMFSNTVRAHRLGMVKDWVVVRRDRPSRALWTVITGQFGRLRGRRMVRGRENECVEHYDRLFAAGRSRGTDTIQM